MYEAYVVSISCWDIDILLVSLLKNFGSVGEHHLHKFNRKIYKVETPKVKVLYEAYVVSISCWYFDILLVSLLKIFGSVEEKTPYFWPFCIRESKGPNLWIDSPKSGLVREALTIKGLWIEHIYNFNFSSPSDVAKKF